jgi:hypothetical protein
MWTSGQLAQTHVEELSQSFHDGDSTPRLERRSYVTHGKAHITTPTFLAGGCHVAPISLQDYPMQCHRSFFTSATCNKTISQQLNKNKTYLREKQTHKNLLGYKYIEEV